MIPGYRDHRPWSVVSKPLTRPAGFSSLRHASVRRTSFTRPCAGESGGRPEPGAVGSRFRESPRPTASPFMLYRDAAKKEAHARLPRQRHAAGTEQGPRIRCGRVPPEHGLKVCGGCNENRRDGEPARRAKAREQGKPYAGRHPERCSRADGGRRRESLGVGDFMHPKLCPLFHWLGDKLRPLGQSLELPATITAEASDFELQRVPAYPNWRNATRFRWRPPHSRK